MQYSIIQKSQLEGALRIDAEYYQPEYLELEKRFNLLKTKTIDDISESVISFGAYSLTSNIVWENDGVPYINVGDIHNGYINFSNVKYISEKVDEILNKSRVNNGQVLLTMAGTIGNAAVVHNISRPANANQAIAKITPIKNISPYYLAAFLNSKYGRLQTQREIVSSVQENIFLGTIKKFKIPVFNNAVTEEVGKKYKNFLNELENSKSLYQQAEDLLLEKSELKDFEYDKILFSIVNLSEVENADRIDAEYFQEKYKKLVKKIKLNKAKKLGDLVTIKKGFEPGSEEYYEEGKLFIRVSSLSVNGINLTEEKYLSEKLYQELKNDYEPKVGEILLTKDASPGIAYAVKEPVEGIMSGGILRLKLPASPKTASRGGKENIEAEYLTLCLNSIVGQMQAERDAGGSVIAHWRPEQIKNIMIPILSKQTQQKIAGLVRKSHEARKKAKELLEEAKRKVEEMIENKK